MTTGHLEAVTAALAEARKQIEYAYTFSPSSYTRLAMAAVQAAQVALSKAMADGR